MPDENTPADAGTEEVAVAEETTQETQEVEAKPDRSDEPLRNLGEVVELRKKQRAMDKKLDQILAAFEAKKEPAKKADAGAELNINKTTKSELVGIVEQHKRDMAFRDAYLDAGLSLEPAQRKMLEKVFKAESPDIEDLPDWLTNHAKVFGSTKPSAPQPKPAATQEPPKVVLADQGSPAADSRSAMSDDLFAIEATAWNTLTPEEKKAKFLKYKQQRSGHANPFAARKG